MRSRSRLISIAVGLCFLVTAGFSADEILLRYDPAGAQGALSLHSTLRLPVSGTYPEYTVWCSTNLQSWFALPGPFKGGVGVSDEGLRVGVPTAGDRAVYKVVANVKLAADGPFGDSIYGHATQFGRELQGLGQLPLDQFTSRYGLTNAFLPQLSFDPTTAEYWAQFDASSLRLNTNELAVFQTNGFVVSERLGSYSFADQFYRLYTADLPVFFSADAALHAWHKSFVAMLQELEEVYFSSDLEQILTTMAGQVPALASESAGTALVDGVRDADLFIAVGRSLVTGTTDYGVLGQNARVQTVLDAITALRPAEIDLFGTNRVVDFSQFQVRGHYTTSKRLQRYFRAMMWCGLADFQFTGSASDNSLRELSGAVAMTFLLDRAGQLSTWQTLDTRIRAFFGPADSLGPAVLRDLLARAGISSPASLPNLVALQNLQTRFMSGEIGVQTIGSGYFFAPFTRAQTKLPRSFAFLGRRFTLDAWALSKCVFDSIIWDEDGTPGFEDKVMRRVPSALDVAFGVLGNNHAAPDIAARIANANGHPWRDGKRYQHNLAAVRNVVDAQNAAAWTESSYGLWLGCLRSLSPPTTGPEYPEAMRTRAWAMKTLNTQLASWTELRHDTLLYAAQSYTGPLGCLYPAGFVEPRTNLWARLRQMASGLSGQLGSFPRTGTFTFEPVEGAPLGYSFTCPLNTVYTNRRDFLNGFVSTMTVLEGISQKELQQQPLTTQETQFLQNLVEVSTYYTGTRNYTGWYPGLFYLNARAREGVGWGEEHPSNQADQLVVDVHTDAPAPVVGDPGSILHEGVGNVLLMMIAVDSGPDSRAVYAGPVFSHYEFELGPATRQTDEGWKASIRTGNLPPQPDWTRTYQVPAR